VSASPTSRGASWRQKLILVLFGLALAVFCLVGLEIGLRVFGVGDDLLFGDPFVGFAAGRDLFERRQLEGGDEIYVTTPEKLAYFNYQEFPVSKGRHTYRIFTLGGSTTAGRPYDDGVSFTGFLRRHLAAADPSATWEVINAGAISYASYRVVLLMKELVRYEPDLFVVYTGHNEFLEERAYPPLIHRSLAAKRLWIWLNGQRTYSLGRRMVQSLRPPNREQSGFQMAGEVAAIPTEWSGMDRYHRDDALQRAIVEHFEYNLHQIVSIARSSGADVLFVVPASNLKDFSPFKSEHSPDLSRSDGTRFNQLLLEAAAAQEASDSDTALALLREAERLDPSFAELQFRIGRALFSLGKEEEAYAAFLRAKDLDVAPLRALEEIVDLVADTGRSLDVDTIDLPAMLRSDSRARYGHGIPGDEYFLDHVHPDISVHSTLAGEIVARLVASRVVTPQPSWAKDEQRRIYDAVVSSIDREGYAQRDLNLAKVLGWAGKISEAEVPLRRAAEVLTDVPEVHLSLGILLEKQKRWAEAAKALEKALELDPSSSKTYFNLGVVYSSMGRVDDGIEALEKAIELRPGYPEALYNLGILQRGSNPERALAALQEALATQPEAAEIHRQIGATHRQLEHFQLAKESFERSLEIKPDSALALAGLGGVLVPLGDLERAERLLREALDRDPELAQASFDLGLVLARSRRSDEALDLYRRAIEIQPDFSTALNNLGIALAGRGQTRTAAELLERAVASDPGFAEAHFNLGVVYDQLGRRSEAITLIARSLELEPENGRFHLAYGMLLLAAGEIDEAAIHLREADRLGEQLLPDLESFL
jgi:tetratricopeptide (TPR) repeat protein